MHFFSGFSDENTKWINPNTQDFRQVCTNGIIAPELPIQISFDIETENSHFSSNVLAKNSKKNSRALIAEIREYKEYSSTLKKEYFSESGQTRPLPLFASFSTEDIHANRKIDAGKFKHYEQKPSFGYYECLGGDGFFPYWVNRLLILQEGRENHDEITIVRNAIQSALGISGCQIVQDLQIRPIQKKIYFILMDGREIESDFLSDGYRRLINIITDIAFRCALLNRGIYGTDACRETSGTVLIDEIDLHLHPSLQSTVLTGLRKTFPHIQFIITSHAPMIMSGIENNEENIIYKLSFSREAGYNVISSINTYGINVSSITENVLGQTPRDQKVDDKLTELFSLIDNEKNNEARTLLATLQKDLGDNLPELSEAEAMLNCIISDNDEENH